MVKWVQNKVNMEQGLHLPKRADVDSEHSRAALSGSREQVAAVHFAATHTFHGRAKLQLYLLQNEGKQYECEKCEKRSYFRKRRREKKPARNNALTWTEPLCDSMTPMRYPNLSSASIFPSFVKSNRRIAPEEKPAMQ